MNINTFSENLSGKDKLDVIGTDVWIILKRNINT
jgi:hypothetical protein